MERARNVRADAERGNHKPKLRNSRVREDAFDVVLRHTNRPGKQRGERANQGDDRHRRSADFRGGDVQRERARDQKHPGGDHRRGVNQRADRRRTFHRVRQPDVERKLRALANRAAENQERDHGDPGHAGKCLRFGEVMQIFLGEDLIKIQAAGLDVEKNQADKENCVADARGEECFESGKFCAHGLRIVDVMFVRRADRPKADEQVRTQAHDFPEQKELEQVRRNHHSEHPARKQGNVGEEAGVAWIVADVMMSVFVGVAVAHITDAVDKDHQANGRHHKKHHRHERIDHHADFEHGIAGRHLQKDRQLGKVRMLGKFCAFADGFK